MKPIKNKLRNFRLTEEQDRRLVLASENAETSVSRLLQEFTDLGTDLVLNDQEVCELLRSRYAV